MCTRAEFQSAPSALRAARLEQITFERELRVIETTQLKLELAEAIPARFEASLGTHNDAIERSAWTQ
jgi:hypothetical protein